MNAEALANGLLFYLGLVVLLTFHEFGHAWTAWRCGDDTAYQRGRVSLNPIVHIDPIGTVALPLLMIFMSASNIGMPFLVGWAKPVPVNPLNLRSPKRDDLLVTLAGPGMNLLLAVVLVGLARLVMLSGADSVGAYLLGTAFVSLMLCFFNLIPVPPLDGSQVVRVLTGMSWETFANFARFGFIILIVLINIPFVQKLLYSVSLGTLSLIAHLFGVPVGGGHG
jgi:Zn-dependent protease